MQSINLGYFYNTFRKKKYDNQSYFFTLATRIKTLTTCVNIIKLKRLLKKIEDVMQVDFYIYAKKRYFSNKYQKIAKKTSFSCNNLYVNHCSKCQIFINYK